MATNASTSTALTEAMTGLNRHRKLGLVNGTPSQLELSKVGHLRPFCDLFEALLLELSMQASNILINVIAEVTNDGLLRKRHLLKKGNEKKLFVRNWI